MSTIAIADIQRTAAPAVRVRLRLTRRGRIVFTTLAALPLLIVVAFFVLNGGQASAGDAAAGGARTQFDTVTIQPGETLWQLAEDTAPNADPRDFVQDVITLNALDGSGLQAGEQIAIPTKYTSGQ
ncbi:LysM domain-containing protein [Curtobacterium sp. PhB42]|uniref:LysM peptidoglycan-binding domain-containing protein n=1 Tax=unclassified Curtobacterium TaxID=257496 RepID=UPI00106286A9|nr:MULTISPECIES: LysM peptidoglycan-binding domain-containing protein [unclassified Curtobacterium]TDW39766.1 LysM domain-containing protein [Curtobacterium sp. PhB42]TDW50890.1 LysM domain-containing protein [Curtobacterium sp. PhB190]